MSKRSKCLITVLFLAVLLSAAGAIFTCKGLNDVNAVGISHSTAQASDPTLQCAGASGNITQSFSTNETIYVQGYGFASTMNFTVYIIPNQFNTALAENFSLPSGATSYVTTVMTTASGNITTTPIWVDVGYGDAGNYTVVCDVSNTTYFNSASDPTTPVTIIATGSPPTPSPSISPTVSPSPSPAPTIPELTLPIVVLAFCTVTVCLYKARRRVKSTSN